MAREQDAECDKAASICHAEQLEQSHEQQEQQQEQEKDALEGIPIFCHHLQQQQKDRHLEQEQLPQMGGGGDEKWWKKKKKRPTTLPMRRDRRRRRAEVIIPAWISRRLTFYRLHLAYFIVMSCFGTACLWLFPKRASHGDAPLSFIDCMYNAVSALCTTGLISVRMRDFSLADDVLLMFLMVLGSTIFTSLIPLYIRQHQFDRNIHELEHHLGLCRCDDDDDKEEESETNLNQRNPITLLVEGDVAGAAAAPDGTGKASFLHKRNVVSPILMGAETEAEADADLGRRSNAKRQALEAMYLESEAISALNWVVSIYFVALLAIGFFVLELFFLCTPAAMGVLDRHRLNHAFFSLFTSVSSLTNSGILLLDENMVPLREFSGILLWSALLILIGNTMFAPCLRAVIWGLRNLCNGRKRMVFDYLLQNPRKCFTHLFPRNQTIWLVVTVMGFNAFESSFFYILSWKSDGLAGLDASQKIVNGIFQSVTTRSAGENVVSVGGLPPSMLVLYIGMMYIAVYPVYLSRQNTQAQVQPMDGSDPDLAKYSKPPPPQVPLTLAEDKNDSKLSTQSRKLLATDSAYLFIAVFTICIIENRRINDDPLNYSVFNVIFEVISAYGNVGLSVGYSCSLVTKVAGGGAPPCLDVPYSFSGKWSVSGKLLMIVIMFLGRHRGLPDNMDAALQIPKSFFMAQQQQQQLAHELQQQQQQCQEQEKPQQERLSSHGDSKDVETCQIVVVPLDLEPNPPPGGSCCEMVSARQQEVQKGAARDQQPPSNAAAEAAEAKGLSE